MKCYSITVTLAILFIGVANAQDRNPFRDTEALLGGSRPAPAASAAKQDPANAAAQADLVLHLSARQCINDIDLAGLGKLRKAIKIAMESGMFEKLANDPFMARGGSTFLPWQRRFLNRMEHLLNVPMPFWDYADESIPDSFAVTSYLDVTGTRRSNPLFGGVTPNGQKTIRHVMTPFPTQFLFELESYAMSADNFGSFSQRLEALHDSVLGAVGGDFLRSNRAPQDPLYWVILSNTDRIFYRWQLRHRLAEPPAQISMLEDASGSFSMSSQMELTIGWDRAFGQPEKKDSSGPKHSKKNFLHGLPTKTDASVSLQFGSAFGHIGDIGIASENVNRTHFTNQSLSGGGPLHNGHGHGHGAAAGIGMSFVSAHGSRMPGVTNKKALDGVSMGAGTDLGDTIPGSPDHPGKGSFNGINFDPVPKTRVKRLQNGILGQGLPGPEANFAVNGKDGIATLHGKAPGSDVKETRKISPGNNVFVAGHNVTHFSNVSIGDFNDPDYAGPIAQASVAISVASGLGYLNDDITTGQPSVKTLGGTASSGRSAHDRSATAMIAKGIQQWGGSGREVPPSSQVSTSPPVDNVKVSGKSSGEIKLKQKAAVDYKLRSELVPTPPRRHVIMKLCDVPETKSPFLVQVVVDDQYIVGNLYMLGAGDKSKGMSLKRDLIIDMTRAHHKLLEDIPLVEVATRVSFRVTNLATKKRVKTPNFTVRFEPAFF